MTHTWKHRIHDGLFAAACGIGGVAMCHLWEFLLGFSIVQYIIVFGIATVLSFLRIRELRRQGKLT